ncbi:MAG: extracellular solute-binding protein [Clostridiales bacterium]|jgi:putative aldouronate transport system substrate-binding protein|nr:extracellular solute-binding protein [Clostridiales bacterium]
MKKTGTAASLCLILCAALALMALAACQPAAPGTAEPAATQPAATQGGAEAEGAPEPATSGGATDAADAATSGAAQATTEAAKSDDAAGSGEPAGAAGFPTTASKDGKYEPAVTLSTARRIEDIMQSKGLDKDPTVIDDNLWSRDFRDILGIELSNQWTAPASQYRDKMNAQIAANDLPDFYTVDAAQLKMVADYGMATDMAAIFGEYACDFTKEMMEADNNVALSQATIDGKLVALPKVMGNRGQSNFFWVRKDWMEKLGISEPKTADEFIEMCRRFAMDDPDGNGQADTVGFGLEKNLFGGGMGLNAFGECFLAYMNTNSWVEVGGKIEYGAIQPETKAALAALAAMYKDGVIDKEFIVKDSSKVNEEIIAGRVGAFGGSHAQAFYPIQDAHNNNGDLDYVALPIVANGGAKPMTMLNGSATDFYVVNTRCANPEAVVKMYNYFYLKDPAPSPEFDMKYHGRSDTDPDWPIDQAYWWAPMQPGYPMQNEFIHMGVEKYFDEGDQSVLENYWIADNVEQNQRYLDGDQSMYMTYRWSGAGDYSGEGRIHYYDQNGMYLINAYTGPNTDAHVQYKSTLDQLMLETFTKIIMGEAPIDEFDTFAAQWKSLGGDRITEAVNAN